MTSFQVKMQGLSRAVLCKILKLVALVVSEIFKGNHFVTAAAEAADIDDSNQVSHNKIKH